MKKKSSKNISMDIVNGISLATVVLPQKPFLTIGIAYFGRSMKKTHFCRSSSIGKTQHPVRL